MSKRQERNITSEETGINRKKSNSITKIKLRPHFIPLDWQKLSSLTISGIDKYVE